MNTLKQIVNITTCKMLMAAAILASLTAAASITKICFIWFYQPVMPESIRHMNKFED